VAKHRDSQNPPNSADSTSRSDAAHSPQHYSGNRTQPFEPPGWLDSRGFEIAGFARSCDLTPVPSSLTSVSPLRKRRRRVCREQSTVTVKELLTSSGTETDSLIRRHPKIFFVSFEHLAQQL
jgi:hypothetical protein